MASPIERVVGPLRNRIANLVARAVVRLVADAPGIQALQLDVLDGETREACERLQEYGFTSHPHPLAEAVVLFVGGRRDHPLVVAVDDRRYRLRGLYQGEVALYTDEGDRVHLKRGRIIEIEAGTRVSIDAPLVDATGSINAGSGFKVSGTQVVGARASAVPPPAGGSTVDGEARAAIGAILTLLRTHGLMA